MISYLTIFILMPSRLQVNFQIKSRVATAGVTFFLGEKACDGETRSGPLRQARRCTLSTPRTACRWTKVIPPLSLGYGIGWQSKEILPKYNKIKTERVPVGVDGIVKNKD